MSKVLKDSSTKGGSSSSSIPSHKSILLNSIAKRHHTTLPNPQQNQQRLPSTNLTKSELLSLQATKNKGPSTSLGQSQGKSTLVQQSSKKSRLLEMEKTFANNNAAQQQQQQYNNSQISYHFNQSTTATSQNQTYPSPEYNQGHSWKSFNKCSGNNGVNKGINYGEILASTCDITAAIMFKGDGSNGHGRTKRVSM
jgi:hypothetical protein